MRFGPIEWYIVIMCIITFLAFGIDKFKAVSGRWRIPEKTLLGLALIGGAAGGLLGMLIFHHKTRKKRFSIGLSMMLIAHVVIYLIPLGYLW